MQKNSHQKATLRHKAGKLLILLVLTITFGTSVSAVDISNIKDISSKDPSAGMYLDLINSNAITLDKQGNFHPNDPINKAAFLKAALTYAGFTPSKNFNFFTGYSDVPEESWFAPYVKKALDSRVLVNQLNDNFYPEQTLNRQEALLLTMSIFGLPTPLATPKAQDLYNDIRITHPLASVYAAAHADKIYFEDDQKDFFPSKTLTRGDAADLLFKAKLESSIMNYGSNSEGYGSVTVAEPSSYVDLDTATANQFLDNSKFPILVDAWNKINNQYVYTDKVNQDQLVYGAINGMVESLNDPYSTFKAPNSEGDSYVYIPEDYEGIGAVIDQVDGNYIIETTITNSPAYRAGLQAKDIIISIAGQEIKDLNPEQITALIKGKAGSILSLQIKRGSNLINFQIAREKITVESIQLKKLDSGINYLRLDQFTENSADEFETALKTIQASGSKKLIIDLRNNPGGYLTSAQAMLNHFLEKGKTEFMTTDKTSDASTYFSAGPGDLKNYNTVILINEGSASAAEIFAGALQDYKLAYLIGNKSFGKGSVQEIINYNDNSSLKLTIAHWLTPNKRDINHVGIVPDKTVDITPAQKEAGTDPQLDAAISYLK